jgi:hypothetical protein
MASESAPSVDRAFDFDDNEEDNDPVEAHAKDGGALAEPGASRRILPLRVIARGGRRADAAILRHADEVRPVDPRLVAALADAVRGIAVIAPPTPEPERMEAPAPPTAPEPPAWLCEADVARLCSRSVRHVHRRLPFLPTPTRTTGTERLTRWWPVEMLDEIRAVVTGPAPAPPTKTSKGGNRGGGPRAKKPAEGSRLIDRVRSGGR